MGMWIGRNRKARVTYGFDEIALVPGDVTINPNEVDTSFTIPCKNGSGITLKIPIIASAMDGVTDVRFCIEMGKLGGLGVINLEGVQTRYENPSEVLEQVVKADKDEVTTLIQKLYLEPIKEDLIARRVKELKAAGVLAAVSSIPQKAEKFGALAQEAGADLRLRCYEGLWHDFQLHGGQLAEADASIAELGGFLRQHLLSEEYGERTRTPAA